jgi:SAM-dependent methyltransferase
MAAPRPLYDAIGAGYTAGRREDPRIAAAIRAALGGAGSVANVGAGTGSYEPRDLHVVAVEPSAVMRGQRPRDRVPAVRGAAEALPLDDDAVDVALAVHSDHHWRDRHAGLRELRRVARDRVVLVNVDPGTHLRFWLTREYLPGLLDLVPAWLREPGAWAAELEAALGGPLEIRPIPVPHDCADGFYGAYWRRPAAYLDPAVRDAISVFHLLPGDQVAEAVARLAADLEDGSWAARHADLLAAEAHDVGLRMVIAGG